MACNVNFFEELKKISKNIKIFTATQVNNPHRSFPKINDENLDNKPDIVLVDYVDELLINK